MELYIFLKKLRDVCVEEFEEITFGYRNKRHVLMIGLYGSTIEYTASLVCLIDNKRYAGVPSVFRSLLEASVEFINLHDDANYRHRMEASNYKQWLKLFNAAKTGDNPYLTCLREDMTLEEVIPDYESKLAELIKQGHGPLNIFERFKRAGMENEYRSIYNSLSCDSHSNIRGIINKHLEIEDDDHSVVLYKDMPAEDLLLYLDPTVVLLLNASKKLHNFFGSRGIDRLEALGEEFCEIRDRPV